MTTTDVVKQNPRLAVFVTHGVHFDNESGDQLIGTCPFTGKEGKFYVNRTNLLWDSKTAGLSGNLNQFLGHIARHFALNMSPDLLQKLCSDRRLPIDAFADWEVGWNGRAYTLPVRNADKTVVDIRTYKPGGIVLATKGCSTGLLGAHRLGQHPTWPVYVCEGEWDTIALEWLRERLGRDAIIVGVPGAGVFKPAWVSWFGGRTVHVLFDHDQAGIQGDATVFKRLKPATQRLTFTHWPSTTKDGYDVRDWVVEHAVMGKRPRGAWDGLHGMFADTPRTETAPTPEPSPSVQPELPIPQNGGGAIILPASSLDDLFTTFRKWLYLDSTDAISIMLATTLSQQIDGEPIWMFLVGPPGSAKTETLSSLSLLDNVYMTSSLTPHSLISGANWKDGMDPSLIPRLNGKVMVIKDFTSILSLRDTEKDEIFGILRDAYDGKCGKEFGNGVVRNYESRFTMLAAVTPSIYAVSSQHTALGERFLKFAVGDNLVHKSESQIISRAIDNIDVEGTMKKDLAQAVADFLQRKLQFVPRSKNGLPEMSADIRHKIICLARWGARMRGSVTRDSYRHDIVTSRPSAEVGSRLGKQLAKLAQSLALIHGQTAITDREYRLIRKTMVDTVPQRSEDVVRIVHQLTVPPPHFVSSQRIAEASRYPHSTIIRLLQDMNVLGVVERVPLSRGGAGWKLTEYITDLLNPSQIYAPEIIRRLMARRLK